ncbi:hypothetical protein ACFY4C_37160 [Actinomadura viridis]|uniref:hypothetical protein n=1 Tax=Actinomadura viridis TaxID=58110 RepID=UPI0036AEC4B1
MSAERTTSTVKLSLSDPRLLRLARVRQQPAYRGTDYVPSLDELPQGQGERDTSLWEARAWLQAAETGQPTGASEVAAKVIYWLGLCHAHRDTDCLECAQTDDED